MGSSAARKAAVKTNRGTRARREYVAKPSLISIYQSCVFRPGLPSPRHLVQLIGALLYVGAQLDDAQKLAANLGRLRDVGGAGIFVGGVIDKDRDHITEPHERILHLILIELYLALVIFILPLGHGRQKVILQTVRALVYLPGLGRD